MGEAIAAVVVVLVLIAALTALLALPLAAAGGVAWLAVTTRALAARVDELEERLARAEVTPAPSTTPTAAVPASGVEAAATGDEPMAAGPPAPEPAAGEPGSEPPTGEPLAGEPTGEPPDRETTAELPGREPGPGRPAEEVPAAAAPTSPGWSPLSPEKVIAWLAAGLGGLTVLLAVLLGLAVVIERGWLGPAVRVAGGLAGGTVLWLGGVFLRRRVPVVGAALSGVAIGVLYGTLFAAHGLYDLLPTTATFAAMVAVTVVATVTAAREGDRFTAHLALVGGLLTPVLVSTGSNRPVALFAYLALLLAGVLGASRRRGWWDVALVAALGAGALHAGWALRWYAADQVPYALGGALALTLPFALAATAKGRTLQVAGFAAAVLLPLLAVPWVLPVDPVFTDPRSGLSVVRDLGGAAWWTAGGVTALALPGWLVARRHEQPFGSAVLTLAPVVLLATATAGWLTHPAPPAGALAAVAVGPLALGVLATAGSRHAARGLFLLPLAAGIALAALVVVVPDTALRPAGIATAALIGLGALGAVSRAGVLLLPTVLGASVALGFAAAWAEGSQRAWVIGPALLAVGVLGVAPLLRDWPRGRTAPLMAAALAWVGLFPALYRLWVDVLGDGLVGALPVLLGMGALLGAATLLRRHRVDRSDPALAAFVAVALLGVVGAVAVQLRESWLTVAWALEAAALGVLARRLRHPLVRGAAVVLGVTVAVRLVLNPWALGYGDAAGWPVLNWTLYTWGVPFLALIALANALPERGDWLDWARPVMRVLALLVGFALVEVEVAHAFRDAGPVELGGHGLWQGMVRSVSWAGYGLFVLLAGLWTGRREVRFLGFCFILLATAKVFAVDLWSLSGFVRVGSVGALGASLLIAAFLFERLVLRSPTRESSP